MGLTSAMKPSLQDSSFRELTRLKLNILSEYGVMFSPGGQWRTLTG